MEPGRELDKLVAEKVFNLTVETDKHGVMSIGSADWRYLRNEGHELLNPVPSYSFDIGDAWTVVEKLVADGWRVETTTSELGGTDVSVICNAGARGRFASDNMEGRVATFPQAMCLAALYAVGIRLTA